MKNLKRVAAAAAVAAVAASSFALAVPAQADATTVTIWGDKDTKDAVYPSLNDWAGTQGLTINWVTKDFGQLRAQAITAIPTGSGPDIIAGAHDWTGKLLGAGVIAPLTLGAAAGKFSAAAKSGFSVNGKLYGVPGWTENIALVYNKTKVNVKVTTKVGKKTVTTTTNPLVKTGADFSAAIAAGKVEVGFDAVNGDPYHFAAFDTSFGLTQYALDKHGNWTNTIGEGGANGARFANWLASNSGGGALKAGLDWNTLIGQLQDPTDKTTYWVTGPWAISSLEGDNTYGKAPSVVKTKGLDAANIGVMAFPSIGGSTVHQFSGVRGYWESSKVKGSAQALSVGKVISYLASATSQSAVYDAKQLVPANQDALKTVNNPILKAFGAAGKNALPMASFVFQDSTWSALGKAEAAIIAGNTGDKTPAQYWQDAIDTLQTTINNS